MGIAESKTKLLTFFTFMCGNQFYGLTAASPLACTSMGELQGSGRRALRQLGAALSRRAAPAAPLLLLLLWLPHGPAQVTTAL